MKLNRTIQIFFPICLLALNIFFIQESFAQTVFCTGPSECGPNQECNITTFVCEDKKSSPPPGSCTQASPTCPAGQICNFLTSRCVEDTGAARSPGGVGNSGGCPSGYKAESGLCLPDTPFSGGFAGAKTLPELVLMVLRMLLTLAGVVAIVLVVVGGYQYMTSGGNDEQAEKGKKALTNAVIGLIIVLLAYAIVQIITNTITKQVVF